MEDKDIKKLEIVNDGNVIEFVRKQATSKEVFYIFRYAKSSTKLNTELSLKESELKYYIDNNFFIKTK